MSTPFDKMFESTSGHLAFHFGENTCAESAPFQYRDRYRRDGEQSDSQLISLNRVIAGDSRTERRINDVGEVEALIIRSFQWRLCDQSTPNLLPKVGGEIHERFFVSGVYTHSEAWQIVVVDRTIGGWAHCQAKRIGRVFTSSNILKVDQ